MRVPGDTLVVPYFVHVPARYDPRRPTPLLVYLHEAVSRPIFSIGYEIDRDADGELLVRSAHANGWLVLYPLANRQLNWVDHITALHTVEAEIDASRRQYNVDESRIWVGGNSDGGRGALWFASRNPNIAAATFHFSTLPLISLSGGARLENLASASRMFAISGGDDNLYTPAKVNPLWAAMEAARAPLRRVVVPDGGHGLASTWANIAWVYDSIASVRRTGTPSTVRWSTDRVEEGRRDWIAITGLDTLAAPAAWHRARLDSLAIVGSAPATAAVEASIRENTIVVRTSRVNTLRIALPSTLIEFGKAVRLVVDGRELFYGRIRPSSQVMVAEFMKTLDRTAPVGAVLTVDVREGKARVNP
jgi:predicted esterase